MGHPTPARLAQRFADWLFQAQLCHGLLRTLTEDAAEVEPPRDGTVLVRVDAAAWLAVRAQAAAKPPEPLNGATRAANGTTTRRTTGRGGTARRTTRASTATGQSAAPPSE